MTIFSVEYFKILNLECIKDLGGPLLLEKTLVRAQWSSLILIA